MSLEETKKELGKGTSIDCSKDCPSCQVKFWLWEYKLRNETSSGAHNDWHDNFHVVGAPNSCEDGKELKNCYCENGRAPVIGPVLSSQQRPAEKEDVGKLPNGDTVYKVRKDFKESCYCKAKSDSPPTTPPPTKK